MRYDVKKYLFAGLEEERDLFFNKAQEAGLIHFIGKTSKSSTSSSESVERTAKAIKILRSLPVALQQDPIEKGSGHSLVETILALNEKQKELIEQEKALRVEMIRVEGFGNFSKQEVQALEKETGHFVQFYCAKFGHHEDPDLPQELVYISSHNGLDYFMALNKEKKQFPKTTEMHFDYPYNVLKEMHSQTIEELAHVDSDLKSYSKYNNFLHHYLVDLLNNFHLEEAKKQADFPLESETLFSIQGWVPVNKVNQMHAFVEELGVYATEVAIEPTDIVPTSLQNRGTSRIGEDLVQIYDVPSATDKDPSLWVLVFFALFFSMIIGDGGYGLILLGIALFVRYKHRDMQGMKRRVLDLFTILGFSCIVWGVLTTSFFGISISPDSPMQKVSVISWLVQKKAAYHMNLKDDVYQEWVHKFPAAAEATTPLDFLMKASSVDSKGSISYEAYGKFADNIMMELALLVGVVHVLLSMGRYLTRNWSNLGWIIFIIGTCLYLPIYLDSTSILNFAFGIDKRIGEENGLYLIYGGLIIAVGIAIFKSKALGLLEAMNAVQIFSDILSYLRLYALGLAGAMLSATMNDLAGSVPFVFGIVILVLGHIVNLVLGIMGGVIHGLRLNFLEWYHYSFEGGGKNFNPLRKIHIE